MLQVSRETTYPDLQKLLMKEMAPILHDDILISAQRVPLFRIRVLDGFEGGAYLDERVELPLYMECVETAVNISQVDQLNFIDPDQVRYGTGCVASTFLGGSGQCCGAATFLCGSGSRWPRSRRPELTPAPTYLGRLRIQAKRGGSGSIHKNFSF